MLDSPCKVNSVEDLWEGEAPAEPTVPRFGRSLTRLTLPSALRGTGVAKMFESVVANLPFTFRPAENTQNRKSAFDRRFEFALPPQFQLGRPFPNQVSRRS